VSCVISGWIMTERQITKWLTSAADAERARGQCLPDKVMPENVARLVLWLPPTTAGCAPRRTGW
jgi:hypothetical protein